jgi:hypothetical protein
MQFWPSVPVQEKQTVVLNFYSNKSYTTLLQNEWTLKKSGVFCMFKTVDTAVETR